MCLHSPALIVGSLIEYFYTHPYYVMFFQIKERSTNAWEEEFVTVPLEPIRCFCSLFCVLNATFKCSKLEFYYLHYLTFYVNFMVLTYVFRGPREIVFRFLNKWIYSNYSFYSIFFFILKWVKVESWGQYACSSVLLVVLESRVIITLSRFQRVFGGGDDWRVLKGQFHLEDGTKMSNNVFLSFCVFDYSMYFCILNLVMYM